MIDHVAFVVTDINEAVDWYVSQAGANIVYHDKTWAMLEIFGTKLALVLPEQHPNHFAIEVNPDNFDNLEFKQHRDGSKYHYLTDPWGNCVELINYGPNSGENT